MKDTVLITGATSFIAQHIVKLLNNDYTLKFLTRNPKDANHYAWDIASNTIDEKALDDVQHIIHLAGAKLNDGTPLTEERKQIVRASRIDGATLILNNLKRKNQSIKTFISASALGYYAFDDKTLEITEDGNKGYGFAAQLSDDWEKAADLFQSEAIAERVVKLRVSLVLGNEGGIYKDFKQQLHHHPSKFKIASGTTYFPWVHVEDMAAMFVFAIHNRNMAGVYNTTAPFPTYQETMFNKMYALYSDDMKEFNKSSIEFNGQYLSSKKIQNVGFTFKYQTIESALLNLK